MRPAALAPRPRRLHAALLPALAALAGCGGPSAGPEEAGPTATARALAWEPLGVFPVGDDGRTGSFEVTLPPGARSVSLRASASGQAGGEAGGESGDEAGGTCFALEGQKPPSTHGYGLWVLPSELTPLGPGETMTLRVSLRDCRFDDQASRASHPQMPREVRVERLVSLAMADTALATLPARIAWMTPDDADRATDEAMVAEALSAARARLAQAGIDLRVEAAARLAEESAELEYGPGDMGALDAAHARAMKGLIGAGERADTPFLPLVLVPCLRRVSADGLERLPALGQAVRVPGGASVEGAGGTAGAGAASGVFVSLRPCDGRAGGAGQRYGSSARLGDVIAHETGHFLGLSHDEDLPGASAGEAPTLMSAEVALYPAGSLSLSPAQSGFARRHPLLVAE